MFLAGLGLGALVGVLYAPKSGRETRQSLIDAAEEGRDFVVTKDAKYVSRPASTANAARKFWRHRKSSLRLLMKPACKPTARRPRARPDLVTSIHHGTA